MALEASESAPDDEGDPGPGDAPGEDGRDLPGPGEDPARVEHARNARRRPRPEPTAERIHEKAASYLASRPSSTANMRRVLRDWALRCGRENGIPDTETERRVENEIDRLTDAGLLDDVAYAEMRIISLAGSGTSERRIRAKLAEKGVDDADVEAAMTRARDRGEAPDDEEAAFAAARRKRIGPFLPDPGKRTERRERDAAALYRAGFPRGVVERVVDAPADGIPGDGAPEDGDGRC